MGCKVSPTGETSSWGRRLYHGVGDYFTWGANYNFAGRRICTE